MKRLQKLQDKVVELSEYEEFSDKLFADFIQDVSSLRRSIKALEHYKKNELHLLELNETKWTISYYSNILSKLLNLAKMFGYDANSLITVLENDLDIAEFAEEHKNNKDNNQNTKS